MSFGELNSKSRGESKMAEKKEVCTCTKCGNEAEMTITCQLIEVEEEGKIKKKQKETRTCSVCGNEADMIIDFEQ